MSRPMTSLLHRLALVVTIGAALFVLASLLAAYELPGSFDLQAARNAGGRTLVTWVAPNGPADSAGVLPGAVILHAMASLSIPATRVVAAGTRQITLLPAMLVPTPLDLLDMALGLSLFILGTFVLQTAADRSAGLAFWRLCLFSSIALDLAPGGRHGLPWVLPVEPVAIALFGPAFVALTLILPSPQSGSCPVWQRVLLWLPALLYLLGYAVYWQQPTELSATMAFVNGLVPGGYILAGSACLVIRLRRPLSADQQRQMHWVASGLLGGLLPFLLFSAVPRMLTGQELVPAAVSILALVALPVGIGLAIVREEFLGITSSMRRGTLRILLHILLLGGVASIVGALAAAGPQRWGLSVPATAVVLSVPTAISYWMLQRRFVPWVEQWLLRDIYNPIDALIQMSRDLTGATPDAIGSLVVTRIGHVLDPTDAMLVAAHGQWSYRHPGTVNAHATREDTIRYAQHMLADCPALDQFSRRVDGQTVLIVPVRSGPAVQAILSVGPKRSGERYTPDDTQLLRALMCYVALRIEGPWPGTRASHQHPDAACPSAVDDSSASDSPLIGEAPHLTERELLILSYMAEGLANKEIARRLGRSERTVEEHTSNIYEKLGAHNRTQAVTNARRKGLMTLE